MLIPGHNDSDAEIDQMTKWGVANLGPDVPWHFTAFHLDWKMLDIPPTSAATLTRARRIATGNGVRYVYTGNVHDEEGGSTYCHSCSTPVIGRNWYEITAWNLDADGKCRRCGAACAGIFEAKPGNGGTRRQPVRLKDFAASETDAAPD